MVKEISSLAEFESETQYPGLVVVDFFTTWCGPCKKIAPILEQMSGTYPDVKFIKVDIEANEDIGGPRNIQSIPTFHFILNGKVVDEIKGADANAIERKINEHKVDVIKKDPHEMSIKELMAVIRNNGLADKAVGLNEKIEFVQLVEEFFKSQQTK
jgi:thioredoxin 1